jgi:hypothetical protein
VAQMAPRSRYPQPYDIIAVRPIYIFIGDNIQLLKICYFIPIKKSGLLLANMPLTEFNKCPENVKSSMFENKTSSVKAGKNFFPKINNVIIYMV